MLPGINGRALAIAAAVLLSYGGGGQASVKIIRTARHHRPVKKLTHKEDGSAQSTNWSGYGIPTNNGAVTYVSGSWTVPTATCGAAEQDTTGYATFWVGIDGYNSDTVEQTGVDSDCVSTNGRATDTPTYYAWFEFYPAGSFIIEFPKPIKPNDLITASVAYAGEVSGKRRGSSGSEFTISITDVTTGQSYSTSSVVSGAAQSSAEWIAEAPCCERNGDILPLADFSPWSGFTSTSATIGGSNTSAAASTAEEVTMWGEVNPNVEKAQPSSVSSGGGFTVTWLNAGP